MIYMCSCGFATDDREWINGHLFDQPGHDERPSPGRLVAALMILADVARNG